MGRRLLGSTLFPYTTLFRSRRFRFPPLHLAECALALLAEDHVDRLAFAPHQDGVHVHESGVELIRYQAAHRRLARSRETDEHHVLPHDAAPFGMRART